MKAAKPLALSILSLVMAPAAFAQNLLEPIFKPFFGIDITQIYTGAGKFIDFILYLMFFMYIMRYTVGKQFEGAAAKSLSTVLAIIFAIGMSVFSNRFGFNIGNLAPLAGLIFFAVIAVLIFVTIKSLGAGVAGAGAWGFLLAYFMIKATANSYMEYLETTVPILSALLAIAVVVAIVVAIMGLFTAIKSGATEPGGIWDTGKDIIDWNRNRKSGGTGGGSGGGESSRQQKKREKEIQANREMAAKLETDISRLKSELNVKIEKMTNLFKDMQIININEIIEIINKENTYMDDLFKRLDAVENEYINLRQKNIFADVEQEDRIIKTISGIQEKLNQLRSDLNAKLIQLSNSMESFNIHSTLLISQTDEIIQRLKDIQKDLNHEEKYWIDLYNLYKSKIGDPNTSHQEKVIANEEISRIHLKLQEIHKKKSEIAAEINRAEDIKNRNDESISVSAVVKKKLIELVRHLKAEFDLTKAKKLAEQNPEQLIEWKKEWQKNRDIINRLIKEIYGNVQLIAKREDTSRKLLEQIKEIIRKDKNLSNIEAINKNSTEILQKLGPHVVKK